MKQNNTDIFVKQIQVGPMMNFSYLVGSKAGKEAVLIDPCWDAEVLTNVAKKENRNITAILVTHAHFDHVNSLEEIATSLKIPVYVHKDEPNEFSEKVDLRFTEDGSTLEEAGLKIKCMHTPGHSPGSQCFLIENTIFTGDTLFVDGCGRVDLEGGDPSEMAMSLIKLSRLPEDIVIYPGHNYGGKPISTIGEQKETNPYLREDPSIIL